MRSWNIITRKVRKDFLNEKKTCYLKKNMITVEIELKRTGHQISG